MKIYDETKTVNIKMYEDDKPDWATDFFNAASLEYNEEIDTYKVDDVDYCVEQAQDWKNGTGDFLEYGQNDARKVVVER